MTGFNLLLWIAFALCVFFSTGRWAMPPAAWIAPLFGLALIHAHTKRAGFMLVASATAAASAPAWYGAVPLPLPWYTAFMLLNSLIATLPYLADRLITPRLGLRFVTTLVFPLATTAVEYVMLGDGPLGSFGAQAYTQLGIAPLAQFASLTGLWGITFVVSWFAAVARWAWQRYRSGRPFVRGVAIYVALVLLIGAWGSARLLTARRPEAQVRIAAFTATRVDMGALMQLLQADRDEFRRRTRVQHAVYLERSAQAARGDARIVLWPELAGLGLVDDVEVLVRRGRALAREHKLYLAMPLFSIDPLGRTAPINRIVIAGPDGSVVLDHTKYGGNALEGTLAGRREIQVVHTPYGTLSAVICWDTDYPAVIRQAGRLGVDILLSPARVWPEVAAIHADMAAFRAIENGLTVVRHSDDGVSAVVDPYGRFVRRTDFSGRDDTLLLADLAVTAVPTWYPLLGDAVGQVSLGGITLLAVLVLVRSKRMREGRVPGLRGSCLREY